MSTKVVVGRTDYSKVPGKQFRRYAISNEKESRMRVMTTSQQWVLIFEPISICLDRFKSTHENEKISNPQTVLLL